MHPQITCILWAVLVTEQNQPLSHRSSFWFLGYDVAAAQASILNHLVTKELGKSLGSRNGGGFLCTIIL